MSLLPSSNNGPRYESTLETAANNVYEAVVENDEDYDEEEHSEDVIWLREQRTLNKSTHWSKRPSVVMLSIIAFLYALGNSVGEGNRQIIMLQLCCNTLSKYSRDGQCNPVDVQALRSNLQMAMSLVVASITLIASGKVGPMSDRYGRKVFMVVLLSTYALGSFLKLFVISHSSVLHFKLMIICELITNLGGGVLCLSTLGSCYVTDVVEPHQRIYYLGLFVSSILSGMGIGPVIGNIITSLASKVDPVHAADIASRSLVDASNTIKKSDFLPIKVEVGIFFTLLLFTIFVLPESRSEKARKKSRSESRSRLAPVSVQQEESHPIADFFHAINFLYPLRLLYVPKEYIASNDPRTIRNIRVAVLILVVLQSTLSAIVFGFGEVLILYGVFRFNWDKSEIGHLITIICTTKACALIFLSPLVNHSLLQKRLKFRVLKKQFDMVDFSMSFIGLLTDSIAYLLMANARSTLGVFIAVACTALGSFIGPALGASVPKFYPDSKIGEIYGALALAGNVLTLVTPIFFLSIYKWSLKIGMPNFLLYGMSGYFMTGAIAALVAKRVLGLDRSTIPLTRSNSVASFSSLPSVSANAEEALPSPTDLNRKNSFAARERPQV